MDINESLFDDFKTETPVFASELKNPFFEVGFNEFENFGEIGEFQDFGMDWQPIQDQIPQELKKQDEEDFSKEGDEGLKITEADNIKLGTWSNTCEASPEVKNTKDNCWLLDHDPTDKMSSPEASKKSKKKTTKLNSPVKDQNIAKVKNFKARTRFSIAHDRGKIANFLQTLQNPQIFQNFEIFANISKIQKIKNFVLFSNSSNTLTKISKFPNFPWNLKTHPTIEMFKILHHLCNSHKVLLSDFEGDTYPLEKPLMRVLNELCEKVNWRRARRIQLLARLRKFISKKTFSTREVKLISKLVNKQKKEGVCDYEAIVYYFPGKTVAQCMQQYQWKRYFCTQV